VSLGVEECFVFIPTLYLPGDTLLSRNFLGKAATKTGPLCGGFSLSALLSGFGCGFAALGPSVVFLPHRSG